MKKSNFSYCPNPYAINEVPFMRLMYRGCYPLALLLNFMKFSPNLVTSISSILAIVAIYCLIYLDNPIYFPIFWFLSLVFDVCDGMIARMTDKKSANGGFYDTFSDQIKFVLIFYAVAIKYNHTNIWIVSFIATAVWLLSTALNNERSYLQLKYENIKNIQNNQKGTMNDKSTKNENSNKSIFSLLKNNMIFWSVYSFFFVLYGNACILIIPISFGREIAFYTLIMFSLIVFKNVVQFLLSVINLNREINYSITKSV